MDRDDSIYIVLCVLFSVLLVVGNLIGQKFVILPISSNMTLELSAGALFYPVTFLLTDLITEFYGKKKANFCIVLAIFMNVTVAFILLGMDMLQATTWSNVNDVVFHKVFGPFSICFIGSVIACYISQALDVLIYLWIRKATKGKWLWTRSMGSTMISLFVDTLIVTGFMTAFHILPFEKMWPYIFDSYMFKFSFSIFSIPLFYSAVRLIKNLQNQGTLLKPSSL